MFAKPKKGKKILDPATGEALPADGAEVRDTPYWRRIERRGDITAKRSAEEKEAAKTPPPPKRTRRRKPIDVTGRGELAGALTVGKS
jgi:hypothetical protein